MISILLAANDVNFSDAGYIIVGAVIAAVIIITILTIKGNKNR